MTAARLPILPALLLAFVRWVDRVVAWLEVRRVQVSNGRVQTRNGRVLVTADGTEPCCCTSPTTKYKIRACSNGHYIGYTTFGAPPYYFYLKYGGTNYGCHFSSEECVESGDEHCTLWPGTTDVRDDCDCLITDPPPDVPPPAEPDPVPCPCAAITGCVGCSGTTGTATRWMVYVDGVTAKTCFTCVAGHRSATGSANGAYAATAGAGPCEWLASPVAITTNYWNDAGCTSLDHSNAANAGLVMNDAAVGIDDNDGEVVASMDINGTFRCCRPNVYGHASASACVFTTGGTAIAIPCRP